MLQKKHEMNVVINFDVNDHSNLFIQSTFNFFYYILKLNSG